MAYPFPEKSNRKALIPSNVMAAARSAKMLSSCKFCSKVLDY